MTPATSSRLQTRDLTYIAVSTVLMAVCAWITIPLPKPFVQFTLQTFALFLTLLVLGGRRGFYAMVVYLLLGAVGAPVFSGSRGGVGVLLDTTGGYILGFAAAALVFWMVTALLGRSPAVSVAACVMALVVCYTFGTVWFLIVYTRTTGPVSLTSALSWCVIPYILPDLVKLALAAAVARRVVPLLERSGIAFPS